MSLRLKSLVLLSSACSVFACSSADDESDSSNPEGMVDPPGETVSKNGEDGCPVESGFAGDDHCITPPESGTQLHYGPTDYDDPDDIAQFILEPGEEVNECYFQKLAMDQELNYQRTELRFREGTHHIIVRALEDRVEEDGFQNCEGDATSLATDVIGGTGTGNEYVFPPSDASDYDGLYGTLATDAQTMLNGHYINSADEPVLQEFWLNFEETSNTEVQWEGINLYGGLAFRIEPGTEEVYEYSCAADRDMRILALNAHMHAHGTRLSAYKVAADGTRTLLMEEFSWEEPQNFRFDSVTENTAPDRDLGLAGAVSGEVVIKAGESIAWECEVHNTSDQILKFRNEVYTGEMCILGGTQYSLSGETEAFNCSRN